MFPLQAIPQALCLTPAAPAPVAANTQRLYAMEMFPALHDYLTSAVTSLMITHLMDAEVSYPFALLEEIDTLILAEPGNLVLPIRECLLVKNLAAYLLMKQQYSSVPLMRGYSRMNALNVLTVFLRVPCMQITFSLRV